MSKSQKRLRSYPSSKNTQKYTQVEKVTSDEFDIEGSACKCFHMEATEQDRSVFFKLDNSESHCLIHQVIREQTKLSQATSRKIIYVGLD